MANFKIKYLDNYKVSSYFDELELPEAKLVDYFYEIVKTENKWGHVYLSDIDQRIIQKITYEKYETVLLVGKNIDLYKLQSSNFIKVTPEVGMPFNAVKITVKYDQPTGNRDSYARIIFHRQVEINYQLNSDFAQSLHSSNAVNKIDYSVGNPAYSFNNINISRGGSPFFASFKVPFNSLSDTIEVADTYYLHTDNVDFKEATDVGGDPLNFATCSSKDSDYVYFVCSVSPVIVGFDYDISNLILDHQKNTDVPSGIIIVDKTISSNIYSFIEPFYDHKTDQIEGFEGQDGNNENEKTKEKDILRFKVFVKPSELWKMEYLNYALFDDILINLVNYSNIIPSQVKGISIRKDNDNLINCYEFNIEVLYNNKVVSIYR